MSTNPSSESYTDVLIVGAGPSGLMAAQALARLGVAVRVVDRREPGAQYGNADGLQPRTLEIWQSYGILEKFSSQAAAIHAMVCYESTKDSIGIERAVPSKNVIVNSRYPYELAASIDTIEATLRESMKEAGGHITQPACPLSITVLPETFDSEDKVTHPVKVVLKHLTSSPPFESTTGDPCANTNLTPYASSPESVVFAKYVIGADGEICGARTASGNVLTGPREALIPGYDDTWALRWREIREYVWGVTDVTVETDFPDCRLKCVIQSSKGAAIIIPREGEKIRIYVQLSPGDFEKTPDGRLDKSSLPPDTIRTKILKESEETTT